MKNTRLICLLLASLMLAASFAGCSENPTETESETDSTVSSSSETAAVSDETETYIGDSLDARDFGGYEFRIHQSRQAGEYITAIEYTGEPINDALFESKCDVEDRFNVTITLYEDMTDTGDAFEAVKRSITAQDNSFDITAGPDFNTFTLGAEGYLYNLYDIEQFDFDQPWWTPNALENLTVNGKLYSASNYMSYQGLHWTRAIVVNKDIAEEYSIEIPYDTVREGNWTFDTFYTYISQTADDSNGNGVLEEDEGIGFTCRSYYTLQEAVDIPIYRRDSEGNIYMDIDVERIDKYVEWMRKFTDPKIFYYGGGHGEITFNKGKTFMAYTDIGRAYELFKDSDFTYGFLSTPKLDVDQAEYLNCCTDQPWGISVTSTDEQLEVIGYICEALSCCNYNNVIPVYFDVSMKSRIADKPDDAEMLQLIRDTRTIGFAFAYDLALEDIYELVEEGGSVASTLARYQKLGNKALELFINNFGGNQ